jgi:ABC-type nitrate/sulfonate/bicarbonate transport system substrate-binding protein
VRSKRIFIGVIGLVVIVLGFTMIWSPNKGSIPLRVSVEGRSISKLPFVIAWDQGLYKKHGLNVRLKMPPPDFEGGIVVRADGLLTRIWRRLRRKPEPPADIIVDGHTPFMVRRAMFARESRLIALASTDCVVRAHIVSRPEISSLEELKGKRLGVSYLRATTGFVALLLAQRMGWDAVHDISIMEGGRDVDALREGKVEAIVAAERAYAEAKPEGFSILADTKEWGISLAGNSVLVETEWLEDPTNREAARRFLMAMVEGIALFHQDRELALGVLARWYGITDRAFAETMYDRGIWIPREPFPCYEGIKQTIELYDSNEMRRYAPEDFYDDSLIREIVENGFVDSLYR